MAKLICESEKLGGSKIFENAELENNVKVDKVRHKNSVIFNHKYSNSIHVDMNQTDFNQPIQANLTNIGSIHNPADICAI